MPSVVGYIVVAVFIVAASHFVIRPVWRASRPRTRITMLVAAYLALCALPVLFGTGKEKWEMLTGIATALAAVVALFYGEIQKAAHAAAIAVRVDDELIGGPSQNKWWLRGNIKNVGDRAVKRCRVKLLSVQGANIQPNSTKPGYFQWQGGINDAMTFSPTEDWIFDLGVREDIQNSPVQLWTYVVQNNTLITQLPVGEYSINIGVYGEITFVQMSAQPC